jgi:anaerobic magnesium-protoporphyrin IX monomethyl ester cyclase
VKFALVNPPWSFDGSIYFGCREPHLPLEYGYARLLLQQQGHEVRLIDGHLHHLSDDDIAGEVAEFAPDRLVITTAPSYLFWRCAPPELRVPQNTLRAISAGWPLEGERATIVVGPHASTTPGAALRKLSADVAVLGECEDILPRLAAPRSDWARLSSIAWTDAQGDVRVQGRPNAARLADLPALTWTARDLGRHEHHHHRFERSPDGPGAEMEVSRGCPYHCTFCAKDNFRDDYRVRRLDVILEEIDALIASGATYVYFIDELFLPNRPLLEALAPRAIRFGIQTRIDLWNESMVELLGRAGCVSIEAGVESISAEGRNLLAKGTRLSTEDITRRLVLARQHVPFVQGNLLATGADDPAAVEAWRAELERHGVWSNSPVPMFPYPGSPGYMLRWGTPDDEAWERATDHYLREFSQFSDIQDARPLPLERLELPSVR